MPRARANTMGFDVVVERSALMLAAHECARLRASQPLSL